MCLERTPLYMCCLMAFQSPAEVRHGAVPFVCRLFLGFDHQLALLAAWDADGLGTEVAACLESLAGMETMHFDRLVWSEKKI